MDQGNIKNENIKIQELLEGYLRFRSSAAGTQNAAVAHMDEDVLAAFVEGDLTSRENNSFMSHLVDCSFCLHTTAELSQLRAAFEAESYDGAADIAQPVKVSEVLSNLFARLFGSSEGVVFAHEEKKEDDPSAEETPDDTEKP
jgi:hypothetical protein